MNKNTEHFQHLHDLAKQIVDDPRSIGAGTAAELRTATLKYAATQYLDTTQALENLYHDQEIGPPAPAGRRDANGLAADRRRHRDRQGPPP
jgi:hypothetical protein